jgi:hypothetical protein
MVDSEGNPERMGRCKGARRYDCSWQAQLTLQQVIVEQGVRTCIASDTRLTLTGSASRRGGCSQRAQVTRSHH